MSSFGESLKHEREARLATVEDVASATGIDLAYLEALERNDVGALPGRAFGMLYIRAYADMLGFDPRPLIEEYERENPRSAGADATSPSSAEPGRMRAAIAAWREEKMTAAATAPVEPEEAPIVEAPIVEEAPSPRSEPEPAIQRSGRGLLVAGLAGALLVIAAGAWIYLRSGDEAEEPRPAPLTATRPPAPEPEVVPPPLPPPDVKPPPQPVPARPASSLRVVESGVGRTRKVETTVDRFRPGELAWFSTRVLGGRSGDRIRHVWIRDGKTIWSKDLALSAADWRTQTSKRLTQQGAWTVEARDATGAVLASASFVCGP